MRPPAKGFALYQHIEIGRSTKSSKRSRTSRFERLPWQPDAVAAFAFGAVQGAAFGGFSVIHDVSPDRVVTQANVTSRQRFPELMSSLLC